MRLANPVRNCRLRPGICRQRQGLRKVESNRVRGPFVEWPQGSGLSGAERLSAVSAHSGKRAVNGVWTKFPGFMENLSPRADGWTSLIADRITALEFERANASIVKSIKQRDLLNTWLRLYAPEQRMPRVGEYQPDRIADELAGHDGLFRSIAAHGRPASLDRERRRPRQSSARSGKSASRYLDEPSGRRIRAGCGACPTVHAWRGAARLHRLRCQGDATARTSPTNGCCCLSAAPAMSTHIIGSYKTISIEDGASRSRI